jgi:hypothetical protein
MLKRNEGDTTKVFHTIFIPIIPGLWVCTYVRFRIQYVLIFDITMCTESTVTESHSVYICYARIKPEANRMAYRNRQSRQRKMTHQSRIFSW